ncbi:hypothetical protein [Fuscibacter oryzae]|uniref:Uncharacterized protein n=1 Tax=Fuscibacter oryzae TaxID=2803939 RepID=A0A8J7MV21_9RHOB|nr:hypothetical protein [Fuscibacter oryzae]MBL4929605.1 hypothetical protein [Fuscibacter oryzae]
MARVVLHIGTHKTATTTLQETFRLNAGHLARHGLIYPQIDARHSGHHGLVTDWNPLPAVYHLPGGSVAALRGIAAAHAAGEATVLLSSEEFSRGAKGTCVDFAAVRAALAGFDRIEVVCVLREQWRFLQSVYVEVSKTRPPRRPPDLLAEALAGDMTEGLWLDYNLLYDHLLTAFAPEEISFLDFDQAVRAEGGIVGHLLAHLGCAPGPLQMAVEGQANRSAPPLPVWGANLIAEPYAAPDWLVQAMLGGFEAETGRLASAGCLWSRAEMLRLLAYAAPRNARLAARLAPMQPGFAVTASAPPPDAIHREDISPGFWMRGARWMFAAQGRKTMQAA